jgi:glycosyltransferase involved in cell wall biosynthesis
VRPDQTFSLGSIASALSKATRLYVHGVADLNRLKDFGLLENVCLFPQGLLPTPVSNVAAIRQSLGISDSKKIVASYGFLLPHKGLPQLIQAFAKLRQQDDSLHLLLLNALYPVSESSQELEHCRALIAQLGIGRDVTMVTDFLADEACAAHLQIADLIVYPYQQTQESSSAAVRMGIASGVAVAVTPLTIFDDVGDAVYRLPGTLPVDLATGIRTILHDADLQRTQISQARAWAQSRQWPWLSNRLLNLIDVLQNE